jgi:hypothetical protein
MDETILEMKNKGICWYKLHLELIQTCKKNSTSFEDRQWLAIGFFNCLRQSAGIEPICPKSKEIVNCLDSLNSSSLQTYNDYLIQVDKDCFFYSKDYFNEKVSKNINNLVLHSKEMMSSTKMFIYNSNNIKKSA